MSSRVLPSSFFTRPTLRVTRELMGKQLCRKMDNGKILRFRVNEAEAYDGPQDKACHAHKGKTPRNAVMFGLGGVWYVYLCYGMHWMLNVVTGPQDYPAAVLLRGAGEIAGPGRLTKALAVDQQFDGKKATRVTGLWFEDDGIEYSNSEIEKTPRIGIGYAGNKWIDAPYRFVRRGGGEGRI